MIYYNYIDNTWTDLLKTSGVATVVLYIIILYVRHYGNTNKTKYLLILAITL